MHPRNKTVDVNRDVATYIEDQYSDETDVATALTEAIEESGADVTEWLKETETDAARSWMQWYGEHRRAIGDGSLPHYRNLSNTIVDVQIGNSLDELQGLCEDLDGTIEEDHLAHCIALRHYEQTGERA